MDLQKLNWKIYFDLSSEIKPNDFFKVFNTWIPNSSEIFVDVADYQHVRDGPLTLLVGHYVDYALDAREGRLGFHYCRKKIMEGDNESKLSSSLIEFLRACNRLEADSVFNERIKFKKDELLFFINDRAIAPNNSETLKQVEPLLSDLFTHKMGEGFFKLEPETNPKKLFSVKINFSKNLPL